MTTNTILNGSSPLLAKVPADAAAHARAWFNATQVTDPADKLERGATPLNVIIAWTIDGMSTDHYQGKSSAPTFAKGELRIFREWANENGKDSSSDAVRAEWFKLGKPLPENSGPNAIVAVITCRRINKDGALSKGKATEVKVRAGAFESVREGKRGRATAQDYIEAAGTALDGLAAIRIATMTDTGEGTSYHVDVQEGENGEEFTTGDWVSTSAAQRAKLENETLRDELAEMRAMIAKLQGQSAE